ncbi:MAG: anti-sigma factor [Chloroflexia bacterium]|nr:anti-sigma factor [Chloroflexia bacterium]
MTNLMDPTTNSVPPGEPDQPLGDAGETPHDAVAAYLLDALPEDERRSFESHLPGCGGCLLELMELAPVVGLLPHVLELDAGDDIASRDLAALGLPRFSGEIPAPSADLRERIMVVARAEAAAQQVMEPDAAPDSDVDAPAVRIAAAPAAPVLTVLPERPRGRIRPGRSAAPLQVTPPKTWGERIDGFGYSRLAAALLALLSAGVVVWALGLQSRLDERRDQLTAVETQIAELRANANASAYSLAPTGDGPPAAVGTLYTSLQGGTGTLRVENLPVLAANQVYQLWYINTGADPRPGGTFLVAPDGSGFLAVPGDTPGFEAVGLTVEPTGGSQSPTLPVIMAGEIGAAFGFGPLVPRA